MSILKRLVIMAGLLGIFFYTASIEQLAHWIDAYQLSWYGLGKPLAWGIVLGCLGAVLRIKQLTAALPWLTLVATMVITLGLTGTAAVAAKHQLFVAILPPLHIACVGVGIYLFGYSYARFMGARQAAEKAHGESASKGQ